MLTESENICSQETEKQMMLQITFDSIAASSSRLSWRDEWNWLVLTDSNYVHCTHHECAKMLTHTCCQRKLLQFWLKLLALEKRGLSVLVFLQILSLDHKTVLCKVLPKNKHIHSSSGPEKQTPSSESWSVNIPSPTKTHFIGDIWKTKAKCFIRDTSGSNRMENILKLCHTVQFNSLLFV